MKFNKLVLALSLAAASSAASAASLVTPFTPAAGMGDAIILQSQVASGVQLGVSVESGIATASLNASVNPTAAIGAINFNGVSVLTPTSTLSNVPAPFVDVYGNGTASALVTQDALALVVVPTSAITSIATIVGITSGPQ